MRMVSWFLGMVLGLMAGGAALVAGVLALLLLIPAVVWAAREKARPIGLGGLFVGLGAGSAALLVLADARCAASNVSELDNFSGCDVPDLTSAFVAAPVLAAIGVGVSILGLVRK